MRVVSARCDRLFTASQPLGFLQAHSGLIPLQKSLPDHPDIGQGKQGHELGRVLGNAPVARLVVTELAFDDSKRVFHFGAHTGLELFGLLGEHAAGRVPVLLALARAYGHLPIHVSCRWPFGNALVAGISKCNRFTAVQ